MPPLPEMKAVPPIPYEGMRLVNPFETGRLDPVKKKGGGIQPDLNRRKEPLEAYPLESLKMVGSIIQDGKTYGLVQADRSLYQVKIGSYLGQDFGVVTKINEDGLSLRELVQDSQGDYVERISTLQLQEKQQGDK